METESNEDVPTTDKGLLQTVMANKFIYLIGILIIVSIIAFLVVVALFAYAKFKNKNKIPAKMKGGKKAKDDKKCDHKKVKVETKSEKDAELKEIEMLINETEAEKKKDEEFDEKMELKTKPVVLDEQYHIDESTSYNSADSSTD